MGTPHHHHRNGVIGRLRSVLRPHSHDATDSIDPALEGSAEGIRALKISLVVLLLTAIAQLAVVLVTGSVALLFAAAVVTGFGFGAGFLGAVATITAGVASGYRAGLLAGIFVVGYLAFSLPSIAAGIAVGSIGLERTAEIYGLAVIVLTLSAVALLVLRRPATDPVPAAAEDTEAIAA